MTRIKTQIAWGRKGSEIEYKERTAYTTPVAGLVVNFTPRRRHQGKKAWTVTHQFSGYSIGAWFHTKQDAHDFAIEIGHLTEWKNPSENLGNMKALGRQVKAAYRAMFGEEF